MMKSQSESISTCCPEFNPALWDNKLFLWENKKFIRDRVCTFFYMPLNFGSVIKRMDKAVSGAGVTVPDWLCLSDHTSKWNMNIYLAVDKEVAGAENTTLHGKYFCKVYEGPFRDTEKWCKDFGNILESKGLHVSKEYMWYTTCPKCARKYGKNYVAIFGKVE